MSIGELTRKFDEQRFSNDYQLIDGVAMHTENGDRFQIPPPVVKKYVAAGQFIQLRLDSSRFSAHPGAPNNCQCPHCNEEATNPILCHEHPATLLELPPQDVPSRGWGEEFWARIVERQEDVFAAEIDNPLYETRLHGLRLGDVIYLKDAHVLAVHSLHRAEMVAAMNAEDLKDLASWLASNRSS